MNSPFLFILHALATYRLALMFSKESGPGRVFRKLRNAPPPRSSWREGLSCIFCESVWFALASTLSLCFMGKVSWEMWWLWWLAGSAVAVVLNQVFTRGDL